MGANSSYQVIARKYRPQTFSSVVGQEAIVTTLKNALHRNRLAHAYLFCGCRGTGKTTLARIFAKALNCLSPTEEHEPCNSCSSCLDITSGRALDVLEIDGASNRGIDDIRQIHETIGYAPSMGKYKIYIIDEVHMLTKEAFNALLKTLEEPPAHVKFFFATTEPHKIPPTILSRCQRFDLNRIPFEQLKEKLQWITQDLQVSCEEEVISLVANLAEGSLRDAESLLDQIICYADHPITFEAVSATLGLIPQTAFFALDKAFDQHNLSYPFELAAQIFSSGKDINYFIEHLSEHYRLLVNYKLNPSFRFPTEKLKEQYTPSLALYTEEQCIYILDYLIQAQQQLSKTPFKRVHLEMLLLHLVRSKYRLTLPTLVKRLHELEQQVQTAPAVATPVKLEEPVVVAAPAVATPVKLEEPVVVEAPTAVIPVKEEEKVVSSLLLSKTAWEAKAAQTTAVPADSPMEAPEKPTTTVSLLRGENTPEETTVQTKIEPTPSLQGCHYDTLIRFAAVELEAVIKTTR